MSEAVSKQVMIIDVVYIAHKDRFLGHLLCKIRVIRLPKRQTFNL